MNRFVWSIYQTINFNLALFRVEFLLQKKKKKGERKRKREEDCVLRINAEY